MLDNNEQKVRRGERVVIPAMTMNALVDSAKDYKRRKYNNEANINPGILTDLIRSNTDILIRNSTIYDFTTSFHIVRLGTTIIDFADDLVANNTRIGFDGFIPDIVDDPIAILQAPCEQDEMTNAVFSGITSVKIKMLDLTDEWANPTPGEHGWLTSSDSGQARILAFASTGDSGETAAGIYAALVNLVGVSSSDTDRITCVSPYYGLPPKTVTTTYTVSWDDDIIHANATGGAFTITLPTPAPANAGMDRFIIMKYDSSGNAVTIATAGSELINFGSTVSLSSRGNSVTVYHNGIDWFLE